MFARSMDPSSEGMWTRVAPYLAILSVLGAFMLALFVLVSAMGTAHALVRAGAAAADAPARVLAAGVTPGTPSGG